MIHNSLFKNAHRLSFYLLILLLPSQLGFHLWPAWAFVLGRRVDYLSPTLYITDVLILLTLVAWFSEFFPRITNYESGIMEKTKLVNKTIIHNSLFIIPVLAFIIANTIQAASPPVAAYHWLKALEFGLLVFYIVKTKPPLFMIHNSLFIAVIYTSFIAIAQFALQHSVGGPLWWLGERTFNVNTPGIARTELCSLSHVSCRLFLRAYATFPHPNVLGGFLAATIPLVIVTLSHRHIVTMKDRVKQIAVWLSVGLGVIALILTFSRSAWVAGTIAIAVAIVGMKNYELRIMNKAAKTPFPMIRYSLFIIPIAVVALSLATLRPADESVVVRQQLNTAAISIWRQSPLIGVGAGNFLVSLPAALPTRTVYFLQPVHNIYLLLLSEFGVVGICLFLLLGLYMLKHESRIMNHGFSIIHYSLFIILLLGMVDHYPLTLQQGRLLFAIMVGLVLM